jgi:hypothetical protein
MKGPEAQFQKDEGIPNQGEDVKQRIDRHSRRMPYRITVTEVHFVAFIAPAKKLLKYFVRNTGIHCPNRLLSIYFAAHGSAINIDNRYDIMLSVQCEGR